MATDRLLEVLREAEVLAEQLRDDRLLGVLLRRCRLRVLLQQQGDRLARLN